MLNLISFTLCFLITILMLFVPVWWIFIIAPILVSYLFCTNYSHAFLSGFIAVFAAWFSFIFIVNMFNDEILSTKIAEIIPLHNPILLEVACALVGGIIGGFGGLLGYSLQSIIVFRKKGKTKYY